MGPVVGGLVVGGLVVGGLVTLGCIGRHSVLSLVCVQRISVGAAPTRTCMTKRSASIG